MAYEAYVFPEGQLGLSTGVAPTAQIAYAQNTRLLLSYGREIHESIDGAYAEHLTGQRADISFSALYTYDAAILRMLGTAIHAKFNHSGANGSAGFLFYSGYVDSFSQVGDVVNPYIYSVNMHFFSFSSYGG